MWKFFSMLFVAGLISATAMETARACGGGCGAMGGGRGYGGRAAAGRKVLTGGPTAQAGLQLVQGSSRPITSRVAVKTNSDKAPAVRTVANKISASAKAAPKAPIYTCPMHPQVQWTRPTDCPLCGMKLKLKQPKTDAVRASGDHAAMNMDETASESEATNDMPGMSDGQMDDMDDMMMCPGCMMNMGGKSGMGQGKQAPAASSKAGGSGMRGMAGMGCGC